MKKSTSDAIQSMERSNYLQTDDTETVISNSEVEPNGLSTVNYNSDVNIDQVSDTKTINYDTTSKNRVAQRQSKKKLKSIET